MIFYTPNIDPPDHRKAATLEEANLAAREHKSKVMAMSLWQCKYGDCMHYSQVSDTEIETVERWVHIDERYEVVKHRLICSSCKRQNDVADSAIAGIDRSKFKKSKKAESQ